MKKTNVFHLIKMISEKFVYYLKLL